MKRYCYIVIFDWLSVFTDEDTIPKCPIGYQFIFVDYELFHSNLYVMDVYLNRNAYTDLLFLRDVTWISIKIDI